MAMRKGRRGKEKRPHDEEMEALFVQGMMYLNGMHTD